MDVNLTQILEIGLIFSAGLLLAVPLLLANVRLAPRLGLIDWPKARGLAEEQIPIIGHSMVLLSFLLFASMNFLGMALPDQMSGAFVPSPSFLVTAAIIAIIGHFDDRKPVPALDKLLFQLACAAFVVATDPQIHSSLADKFGFAGTCWGVFFLIGLMNAVNFIDGIDGLAGLVLFHGVLGFVVFSYGRVDSLPYTVYGIFLMGMLVPFLYLNVLKRRGFLGNVGSYFFSYVIGMMHLSLPIEAYGPITRLSLPSLCFLVPISDSLMVILSRVLTLRSPFQADKGHLHHRLLQTSLPLRFALLNFGMISLVGTATALALYYTDGAMSFLLPGFVLVALATIVSMLIVLVERTSKKRIQSYFKLLDSGETVYFLKYKITLENGKPVPGYMLRKLEAKMNAEIRVTDLCYSESPDTLFVTLRTMPGPLKGISARLDQVFHHSSYKFDVTVEQGELIKVPHLKTNSRKKAS
jgi:UDP-GlcNAc:undecaprenyl-phosphate/decaprenyl-phosphate GlcNAc-1-phosphate transferase